MAESDYFWWDRQKEVKLSLLIGLTLMRPGFQVSSRAEDPLFKQLRDHPNSRLKFGKAIFVTPLIVAMALSTNAHSAGIFNPPSGVIDPSSGTPGLTTLQEYNGFSCGTAIGYDTITCSPDPGYTGIFLQRYSGPSVYTPVGMYSVVLQTGIRQTVTYSYGGGTIVNYYDGAYREAIGSIPISSAGIVNQVSSALTNAKSLIGGLGNSFLGYFTQPLPKGTIGFTQDQKDVAAAFAPALNTAETTLSLVAPPSSTKDLITTIVSNAQSQLVSQPAAVKFVASVLTGAVLIAAAPEIAAVATTTEAFAAAGSTLSIMATVASTLSAAAELIAHDPPDPNYQSFFASQRPQVSGTLLSALGAYATLAVNYVNAATNLEADINNLVNDSQKGAGATLAGDVTFANLYAIDFASQEVIAASDYQTLLSSYGALSTALSNDASFNSDIALALQLNQSTLNDPRFSYIISPDFISYTQTTSPSEPSLVPEPSSLSILGALFTWLLVWRTETLLKVRNSRMT